MSPKKEKAIDKGELVSETLAVPVPLPTVEERKEEMASVLETLGAEAQGGGGGGEKTLGKKRDYSREYEKRKRGRPPKVPQPEITDEEKQAKIEQARASFSLFSGVVLDLISPRLPNPIAFTTGEKKAFADVSGAMIDKYLPTLGGYDAEIGFTVVCIGIFLPRLIKAKDSAKKSDPDFRENGLREIVSHETAPIPV